VGHTKKERHDLHFAYRGKKGRNNIVSHLRIAQGKNPGKKKHSHAHKKKKLDRKTGRNVSSSKGRLIFSVSRKEKKKTVPGPAFKKKPLWKEGKDAISTRKTRPHYFLRNERNKGGGKGFLFACIRKRGEFSRTKREEKGLFV